MNVKTEYICRCSFKTTIVFKKPHVVEATHTEIECSECGSRWRLRILKDKGKGQVRIQSAPVLISPLLTELLKEEAEFANQPVEGALP